MGRYSGLLFATPSLAEGIGRLIDVGDTLTNYNYSNTPEEADTIALASDWWQVGDDLRAGIQQAPQPGIAINERATAR